MRTPQTLAAVLRHKIETAPSLNELSIKARVDRTRLRRFVRHEQGLTVAVVDRLLPILGLAVVATEEPTP
jgi:hypothetical protein